VFSVLEWRMLQFLGFTVWIYLTSFDPASIIVSNSSLEEANRLRSCYRKDLPCHDILPAKKGPIKRKAILSDDSLPPAKKQPVKFPLHLKGATHSSGDAKKYSS